jgi:Zn-dependent protease
MGHVIELRKFGIPADAPMFIPGFGAFVRLRRLSITPIQDARIGLAGPIYGLGAAIAALGAAYLTGSKAWAAVAHLGAVINLFNLIPIWQLDGSRGFHSLTQRQRSIIVGLTLILWFVTSEPMLFLIALVAAFRLFQRDAAAEPDSTGLLQFAALLVALSGVVVFARLSAA